MSFHIRFHWKSSHEPIMSFQNKELKNLFPRIKKKKDLNRQFMREEILIEKYIWKLSASQHANK